MFLKDAKLMVVGLVLMQSAWMVAGTSFECPDTVSDRGKRATAIYALPHSCTGYATCVGKIKIEAQCPDGSVWNDEVKSCLRTDAANVKCNDNSHERTRRDTAIETVAVCASSCPQFFDPRYLVLISNANCNRYNLCVLGLMLTVSCPNDLRFNKEKCACDFKENVYCEGDELTTLTEVATEPTTEKATTEESTTVSSTELSSESTTEAATEEASESTTEEATSEASTEESTTESSTESSSESTTEAATEEASESTTEEATTEASTEESTTESSTETSPESTTEAATEEASESTTEEKTSEESTTESSTESSSESTTEVVTEEASESTTEEATSEASTEESTTEIHSTEITASQTTTNEATTTVAVDTSTVPSATSTTERTPVSGSQIMAGVSKAFDKISSIFETLAKLFASTVSNN